MRKKKRKKAEPKYIYGSANKKRGHDRLSVNFSSVKNSFPILSFARGFSHDSHNIQYLI